MNDYKFGNFLYMLREKKGMTQLEIAEQLGVTPAAVSKWENGSSKPRIEILFRLAEILEVRPEELMAGTFLAKDQLDPNVIKEINERYEYLRKVDSYQKPSIRFRRLLAWVIDWNLIGFTVLFIFSLYFSTLQKSAEISFGQGVLAFFLILLYPVCFILRDFIFGGRSLGKRITGLYILDRSTGLPAKAGKCILRNLFLLIMQIDVVVLLVSGLTIGDRAANTVVITKKILNDDSFSSSNQKFDEINKYTRPNKMSSKKVVIIVVLVLLIIFLLFYGIIRIVLSSLENNEECKISYEYLVESDSFKRLNVNESKIQMNQYSSYYTSLDSGDKIHTVEVGFTAGFHSFQVICHERNGVWQVCEECTTFN